MKDTLCNKTEPFTCKLVFLAILLVQIVPNKNVFCKFVNDGTREHINNWWREIGFIH